MTALYRIDPHPRCLGVSGLVKLSPLLSPRYAGNRNVIFTALSSLAAPNDFILTTLGAADDEKAIKMTFLFWQTCHDQLIANHMLFLPLLIPDTTKTFHALPDWKSVFYNFFQSRTEDWQVSRSLWYLMEWFHFNSLAPGQGVWKSQALRALLGERNVKKKKKLNFRHS